jgi:hypothetical protein
MKNITLLLAFVILSGSLAAQVEEPHKPMSRFMYKIYVNRLDNPKSEERRMRKGVRMMRGKHISSNQLYKVAEIFTDDEMRLVYVKKVYPKISDKSNAIIVCDAFDKFSHSQILWEYIKEQNVAYGVPETDMESYTEYLELKDRKKDKQKDDLISKTDDKDKVEDVVKDETPVKDVVEPDKTEITEKPEVVTESKTGEVINGITFPEAAGYTGLKGCDGYLGDKQFLAFANSLAQFPSDEEKAKICMEYVYTYCFNTAQVMKLGMLMEGENYRYIFFKTAYEKVYDMDNFLHVKQLLTNIKLKTGINEIYIVPGTDKPYAIAETTEIETKCFLSESEFNLLKAEIRKESSSTARVVIAKKLINENTCISSAQIKDLLPLFSLEADKLDIAKFSYKYSIDRNNYSVVKDFFTAQSSKNEINEFINSYSE